MQIETHSSCTRHDHARSRVTGPLLGLLAGFFLTSLACAEAENLGRKAEVTASSEKDSFSPTNVVDGEVSDPSRWLADSGDGRPWLELRFEEAVEIAVVDVYSGYGGGSAVQRFDLKLDGERGWQIPDGGRVRDNSSQVVRVEFPRRKVSAIRIEAMDPADGRIREVAAYADAGTKITTGLSGKQLPQPPIRRDTHQVAVNQIGYDPARPIRFTAPLSPDGTHFALRKVGSEEILRRGKIQSGVGVIESPEGFDGRFEIELRGGGLKAGISDPFIIRKGLYQEQYWQAAVDFLNDSRSVVGTHPSAYGGSPWRDGTYYDAMIPCLVLFYLSDKEHIDAMPRQISWESDKARVLAPDFRFDAKNPCSEGVMDAVRSYYELEPPNPDAPDVVKLIHWGAGYYLVNPATKDPSGDPLGRKVHSQTIEMVSYVLWAWPTLKEWLPQSFYDDCLELCLEHWESMGALEVPKLWSMRTYQNDVGGKSKNPMGGSLHPYKGRHAPGHSIVPNLIMYEVAKREQHDNAERYLEAAVEQAAWIVDNLDWDDPRTTKGHRMSEHRTITNLVWMLQKYPEQAPPGLESKVREWARVAVSRSNNMWDFRRYDLDEHWTIPKLNDVGNVLSLPSIALAASWVVEDPAIEKRLEEMAVGAIDHVFGRNPRLAAAPSQPEKGFPEIERGWPKEYGHNVCARLELCRGSISSSPGSEMFPFNPEGSYRHAEGWVNYGASWCLSLAYLKFDADKTTPEP